MNKKGHFSPLTKVESLKQAKQAKQAKSKIIFVKKQKLIFIIKKRSFERKRKAPVASAFLTLNMPAFPAPRRIVTLHHALHFMAAYSIP